jgi:hypothetical protein
VASSLKVTNKVGYKEGLPIPYFLVCHSASLEWLELSSYGSSESVDMQWSEAAGTSPHLSENMLTAETSDVLLVLWTAGSGARKIWCKGNLSDALREDRKGGSFLEGRAGMGWHGPF